ncbi:MAG: hypothetical protein WCA35_14370 [Kovacikia sp.]
MALLYGMGDFDLETIGLSPELFLPLEPMGFSIDAQTDQKESTKWVDGVQVTAGAANTKRTFSVKIDIEAITWAVVQVAFNELSGVTASVSLPTVKRAVVPATSPFEIVDSDITTTNVAAGISQTGVWGHAGHLTKVSDTPDADREFQVLTLSHKLVFDESLANAPVMYRVFESKTSVPSIGAEEVYTKISNFSFSGLAYGDEETYKIVIPRMSSLGVPNLSISDVTRFELQYKLIVSGTARLPFKLYNLTNVA